MKLHLAELVDILADIRTGTLHGRLQGADTQFSGLSTDTRRLKPGQLFVALRGDNFDGHKFVRKAASLDAAGALVEAPQDIDFPQVVVNDSLAGLQRLATAWRGRFDLPVIGVTGSNGKTTVKQMLACVLGQRCRMLATHGNLNNHIGVPLTLAEINAKHAYAVIEMGASHAGEIALLAGLARPSVAVVTNAGSAHLEGFGSRDGVAHAKGEIFSALPADGVAVINADDVYAPLWLELAGTRRTLSFGLQVGVDVGARAIESDGASTRFRLLTPAGEAAVELSLSGRHNVMNALATAAVAYVLGLPTADIAYGLSQVEPVAGRLQLYNTVSGVRIIDDSYNANPTSLAAALDSLSHYPGEHWLVLGDMAELGAQAYAAHAEAGRAAAAAGITRLYAVGELSRATVETFGERGRHCPDQAALIAELQAALVPGITVLIKGSRSARMDRVVQALQSPAPQGQASC